ncbi:MAG: hypothetical protein FWC27_14375 [Firmicutes bacterium]|nr:hypothetical protein [Bacillota bacterium]
MPNTRDSVPVVQDKEIGGVMYHVTSHFSASGFLNEMLKKTTIEAIRNCKEHGDMFGVLC